MPNKKGYDLSPFFITSSLFFFFLISSTHQALLTSKVNNIFFLKTHKTGSSTFSSILKRLAINFKSRTPLQINESPFYSKTLPTKYTTLNSTIGLPGPPFGVWANHIRLPYGLQSAKLLVPHTERIITAVRDPPTRFASYVCYFDRQCDLKLSGAPWALPRSASRRMGAMDLNHREIINTTHFAFSEIASKLENNPVEDTPLRIIVMERFDESLALFSLDFGLNPFDVAYNFMKKKNRPGLVPQVRDYLIEHQPNDMALYRAAVKQLDRRIRGYPKDVFERRLEEMNSVRDAMQRYCFRTRPGSNKNDVKRVENGEEIDWNKERGRETMTKNNLNKRFALETLQTRMKEGNKVKEVPMELQGLDMAIYGSLPLQCFLMEMDELRWFKWTTMWKEETEGLDLTVRHLMEKSFSSEKVPHRNPHSFGTKIPSNNDNNNNKNKNNNNDNISSLRNFFQQRKKQKTLLTKRRG